MTVICKTDVIRLKGELTHSVFNFFLKVSDHFLQIFKNIYSLEIKMFDQIEAENTLHQIVSWSWNVIDHSEDLRRGVSWYFML